MVRPDSGALVEGALLQQYEPHGGALHKVYVLGAATEAQTRESLRVDAELLSQADDSDLVVLPRLSTKPVDLADADDHDSGAVAAAAAAAEHDGAAACEQAPCDGESGGGDTAGHSGPATTALTAPPPSSDRTAASDGGVARGGSASVRCKTRSRHSSDDAQADCPPPHGSSAVSSNAVTTSAAGAQAAASKGEAMLSALHRIGHAIAPRRPRRVPASGGTFKTVWAAMTGHARTVSVTSDCVGPARGAAPPARSPRSAEAARVSAGCAGDAAAESLDAGNSRTGPAETGRGKPAVPAAGSGAEREQGGSVHETVDGSAAAPAGADALPAWLPAALGKYLRDALGLTLFNLDIIRPAAQLPGQPVRLCVVDINYFPGFDKLERFEERFVSYLLEQCAGSGNGQQC